MYKTAGSVLDFPSVEISLAQLLSLDFTIIYLPWRALSKYNAWKSLFSRCSQGIVYMSGIGNLSGVRVGRRSAMPICTKIQKGMHGCG